MTADENFGAQVDESVARNVKRARERAGWSQADVARLMTEAGINGFHQTTIARIESAQRTLRLAEALVLARILEYRVEDLVESTETALLRESRRALEDDVEKMRSAVRGLLHNKQMVAAQLDRDYPWNTNDETVSGEYLRVNPQEFEMLDELLQLNSDPSIILMGAYDSLRTAMAPMVEPFVLSRQLELYEDAMSNSWRALPVSDLTDASEQEFMEAIARFGKVERDVEHPEEA